MIGKPKYKAGDLVHLYLTQDGKKLICKGVVDVVDPDGTSEQQEEPSYDISTVNADGARVLIKHCRESIVEAVPADQWLNEPDLQSAE